MTHRNGCSTPYPAYSKLVTKNVGGCSWRYPNHSAGSLSTSWSVGESVEPIFVNTLARNGLCRGLSSILDIFPQKPRTFTQSPPLGMNSHSLDLHETVQWVKPNRQNQRKRLEGLDFLKGSGGFSGYFAVHRKTSSFLRPREISANPPELSISTKPSSLSAERSVTTVFQSQAEVDNPSLAGFLFERLILHSAPKAVSVMLPSPTCSTHLLKAPYNGRALTGRQLRLRTAPPRSDRSNLTRPDIPPSPSRPHRGS